MEIHSDNVNMLNEWAAVLFHATHSSSFEWIKEKKKEADPEDSEMGLAEVLTCGFEQWSYLVRNTNVYSVALFTI